MLTIDERINQVGNFQNAIAEIVDQYLKEGMDPETVAEILRVEAGSDLYTRREELDCPHCG